MKPTLLITCGFVASLYGSLAQRAQPAPSSPLLRMDREALCVTNGVVSTLGDGRLAINSPSSRAVVRVATAQIAEIRFRYLGPSEGSKPLASGELRRQIGLKLRAQDTCNLLYAMWHIEPDSKIAVSVKRNAGKHTHQECGAKGYVNIKPRTSVALPRVLPGESHTLRAELRGMDLTLVADGAIVWTGTVGNAITTFDGPVGLRTDNARFVFEYYAAALEPGSQSNVLDKRLARCQSSPGD